MEDNQNQRDMGDSYGDKQAFWSNDIIKNLLQLPRIGEGDGFNGWADVTIPRAIEDKYYCNGRTGAQAIIAFYQDVHDGKLIELCDEFGIPDHVGIIHSVSTLAKHFYLVGKMNTPKF